MSWNDFKGVPPKDTWFLAHIYWAIDYEIINKGDKNKPYVKANARVLPKSWVGNPDD
jgi:hypothetical protein